MDTYVRFLLPDPLAGQAASSKEKRYHQHVEKALASFDTVEEWADYISFLSRLQKALQLGLNTNVSSVPYAPQISHRLALCLLLKLPNGVHQKTLHLYDLIFTSLTPEALNLQISVWLPGFLPLILYCSVQLKPTVILLFLKHILAKLKPSTLHQVAQPLVLAFLPGLDDENSETFGEILQLMDEFKRKLADDAHFWQLFFICVINSPEKRLGAFLWCNKRLPVFSTITGKAGEAAKFSGEAIACISPNPDLLIRCFAASISSTVSMVAANDIIVIRGFFDLLLTHLPLDCEVLVKIASKKDKELLLRSCLSVTLKKDMSLNRRLWNWLLGPDNTDLTPSKSSKKLSRTEFLVAHSLEAIVDILLADLHSSKVEIQCNTIRISLALIMDKWEISKSITPRVFLPIIRAAYESEKSFKTQADVNDTIKTKESSSNNSAVFIAAKSFFDSVEADYIWKDIVNLLNNEELFLVNFIVSNFDISEEEMVTKHIPLAFVLLLVSDAHIDKTWHQTAETLLQHIPLSIFYWDQGTEIENSKNGNLKSILPSQSIKSFYGTEIIGDFPWSVTEYTFVVLSSLVNLIVENFETEGDVLRTLCELLAHILSSASISLSSDNGSFDIFRPLLDKIIELPHETKELEFEDRQKYLLVALSVVNLIGKLLKFRLTIIERSKILRNLLSNLYTSLISSYPTNYQVEAVNAIFELHFTFEVHQIEAGIVRLFTRSTSLQRTRALWTLWIHSNQFSESDSFLTKPLQFVLDDLELKDEQSFLNGTGFVSSVLKSGSANRLLKLLTNPLLEFDFLQPNVSRFTCLDDLDQFAYYVLLIVNVIKTDEKHLKECFNNELAVINNAQKLQIASSNGWDISTYKSLVFNLINKVLHMQPDENIFSNTRALNGYYKAISKCLELFVILLTGNEHNFKEQFPTLLSDFSQFFNKLDLPEAIELVQVEHLTCLSKILTISESQVVNLNLLHIEEENKEPAIIKYIVDGISKSESTILLQKFVEFMTKSLYAFNESVFGVILNLTDALIHKIELYFKKISKETKFSELTDFETAINILISGLEDLLSISHSYLLSSSFKAKNDKNAQNSGDGFLGNVIQGVFLIESPSIKTTEENKRYSIILAFQDSVKAILSTWLWADEKTRSAESAEVSLRSLAYIARKLKFKLRKFLESLIELERQEVVEILISVDRDTKATIKLLHVLDGGRSQITLPHILNSIMTILYPQALGEKQKSSLSSHVSAQELCGFFSDYIDSVDMDTINDIWNTTMQFFKEVNGHQSHFKSVVPELLLSLCSLSAKLSGNSKLIDQKKYKKELSDVFIKLFTYLLNAKVSTISSESTLVEEKRVDQDSFVNQKKLDSPVPMLINDDITTDKAVTTQENLHGTLNLILENLEQIVKETDKVSTCINSVIVSLVSPQIKLRKIHEISTDTISLISLIGFKYPNNKAWRSIVLDCFFDNTFFKSNHQKAKLWEGIVQQWISSDKDKTLDIFSKISPPTSSTANIFNWNESSEMDNKLYNMKRANYVILVQPKDFFLGYLSELYKRFEVSAEADSPLAYRAELSDLLRVITLKFSEIHLLPFWTLTSQFLSNNFGQFQSSSIKELSKLQPADLKLILKSCKLLDQLLLLKFDEFNLQEWLYVTVTPEVTEGRQQGESFALIDLFYNGKDLKSLKGEGLKLFNEDGDLKPLLKGVHSIDSLSKLRTFFQSLSLLQYERMYSLNNVDFDACVEDVFNDILVKDD